jgi:hypothetical protein
VEGNESEEDARQIAGEPLAKLRKVRAGDQPQDCEGARLRSSGDAHRPRR